MKGNETGICAKSKLGNGIYNPPPIHSFRNFDDLVKELTPVSSLRAVFG